MMNIIKKFSSTRSNPLCRTFCNFAGPAASSGEFEGRRKILLYRSRQRGLLELDVIMGSFADKNLNGFTTEQLDDYEAIVSLENPDLLLWLNGQKLPEPELLHNPVFRRMLEHISPDHPSLKAQ